MTGLLCVGLGVLILVLWLWFSYRRVEEDDGELPIQPPEEHDHFKEWMDGL